MRPAGRRAPTPKAARRRLVAEARLRRRSPDPSADRRRALAPSRNRWCSDEPGGAGGEGSIVEPAHITSSTNVGVLTEEQFTALCDERDGTVEVMPHCGGFATAAGFSYDSGTLSGTFTVQPYGGWNCITTK